MAAFCLFYRGSSCLPNNIPTNLSHHLLDPHLPVLLTLSSPVPLTLPLSEVYALTSHVGSSLCLTPHSMFPLMNYECIRSAFPFSCPQSLAQAWLSVVAPKVLMKE